MPDRRSHVYDTAVVRAAWCTCNGRSHPAVRPTALARLTVDELCATTTTVRACGRRRRGRSTRRRLRCSRRRDPAGWPGSAVIVRTPLLSGLVGSTTRAWTALLMVCSPASSWPRNPGTERRIGVSQPPSPPPRRSCSPGRCGPADGQRGPLRCRRRRAAGAVSSRSAVIFTALAATCHGDAGRRR